MIQNILLITKNAYLCNIKAPIVQWIEYRIPVPTIGVRLPMGVQSGRDSGLSLSFFMSACKPAFAQVCRTFSIVKMHVYLSNEKRTSL